MPFAPSSAEKSRFFWTSVSCSSVAESSVVLRVARRTYRGMNAFVVPALVVHGVDEHELDLAGIDLIRQRRRDVHVVVLAETPRRRREKKNQTTELPEPEILHLF